MAVDGLRIALRTSVICIRASGERVPTTIEIGQPYETGENEAACALAIRGLHDRFPVVHGVDAQQALSLAVRLVRQLLRYFEEDGGRVLDPATGDSLDVAAHLDRILGRGVE